ncbi:hypothetical protein E4U51_005792 [Claviceps purpurea]|nr:hypothetical protein E4U51_005792 [Claviceps purpurea]
MVQAEFILRDKSEFLFRLLEDTAHADLSVLSLCERPEAAAVMRRLTAEVEDVLNYEISVMVPDGFELEARLFWRLGLGRSVPCDGT